MCKSSPQSGQSRIDKKRSIRYHDKMLKKWLFRLGFLSVIGLLLFVFQFSWEDGELVIRMRTSDQREILEEEVKEVGSGIIDAGKDAAGKVRYEGPTPTDIKDMAKKKASKKIANVAKERIKEKTGKDLHEADREKLEQIIEESLE